MSEYLMKDKIKKANGGQIYGAFIVSEPEFCSKPESENLREAISLLRITYYGHKINEILEELGRATKLDVSILFKSMRLVMNPKRQFEDNEKESFFNEMKKLDQFRGTVSGIAELEVANPSHIELWVLGLSFEEIEILTKDDFILDIKDVLFKHTRSFFDGTMEYDEFISSLNKYLELEKKNKLTKAVTD